MMFCLRKALGKSHFTGIYRVVRVFWCIVFGGSSMEHDVYGIVFWISVSLQLQLEDGRDILGYLDGESSELSIASGSVDLAGNEALNIGVEQQCKVELHQTPLGGHVLSEKFFYLLHDITPIQYIRCR